MPAFCIRPSIRTIQNEEKMSCQNPLSTFAKFCALGKLSSLGLILFLNKLPSNRLFSVVFRCTCVLKNFVFFFVLFYFLFFFAFPSYVIN